MPGLKTAQVFMNVVVLHFPPVFSELLYNSLLNRITEYNNKACICLAKQSIFQADQLRLRGAIIKKTEKFPYGGAGVIFFLKKVPISIWEHRESRGGSQFFKNVPISIILQLFCNVTFIRNV